MFEGKVKEEVERRQESVNEKSREYGSEPKAVDQNKIRKRHLEALQGHMDEQIGKRQYRLKYAQDAGDTTTQLDLIAA